MFERGAQVNRPNPLHVNKNDVRSDLITFDLCPVPWIHQSEWILSKEGPRRKPNLVLDYFIDVFGV